MARKVRGFERVLDAPALFSVAYGEIGSSIYFALGIVAAQALGLTPRRPARARGCCSCVVSLSYAEGTAAIPETGGAATFARRAFNDLAGFADRLGALPRLPDRDRALGAVPAALPRPRRSAAPSLKREPVGRGRRGGCDRRRSSLARLVRRSRLYTDRRSCVAVLDLVTCRCSLVVLGFAVLFSPARAHERLRLRHRAGAGTTSLFALPLAMLAYTGLETVANLAEEAREPGDDLPRSLFSSIGLVVVHRRC